MLTGACLAVGVAAVGFRAIGAVIGGVLVLAAFGFSLWVGLRPGDPGANAYGPPPIAQLEAETAV